MLAISLQLLSDILNSFCSSSCRRCGQELESDVLPALERVVCLTVKVRHGHVRQTDEKVACREETLRSFFFSTTVGAGCADFAWTRVLLREGPTSLDSETRRARGRFLDASRPLTSGAPAGAGSLPSRCGLRTRARFPVMRSPAQTTRPESCRYTCGAGSQTSKAIISKVPWKVELTAPLLKRKGKTK